MKYDGIGFAIAYVIAFIVIIIIWSCQKAEPPQPQLRIDGDKLVIENYTARALAAAESEYNPAGQWYDWYYEMLERIVDDEPINVVLRQGIVLRFENGRYWTEMYSAPLHPPPRPIAGDIDGDGDCDLFDLLIDVDILLGKK